MNQKVKDLSGIQQIAGEFKIIALVALVATAAIWLYVSMNLVWVAITYMAFLVFISFLYYAIGSSADGDEGSSAKR